MALVIAMLVLLVLTMLAMVLMASVAVNRQVAGIDVLRRKALDNADAGVAEALMRIRNKDVGMTLANPRATAQIYLAPTGSIPVVGADTIAMATAQPVGNWLAYSTPTKTPNVLTINWKTDAGRTQIYRYDPNAPVGTPKIQLGGTGYPIYEITSTGMAGYARRTVITDVVAKPITVNVKSAVCVGKDVNIVAGNAVICGYNHSVDTAPVGQAGDNGQFGLPPCFPYEATPAGNGALPAVWSTGSITGAGGATTISSQPNQANQTGFYNGPWDMLNMTQTEFASFIGAPVAATSNINGLVYIDNDLIMGNQSATGGSGAAFHNTQGEGMLYVDGDLTLNAGFIYTGLVYIEGNLVLNGSSWILGGLVVRGTTKVNLTGGCTVLYSNDAITQKLSQYAGQFVTVAWREK